MHAGASNNSHSTRLNSSARALLHTAWVGIRARHMSWWWRKWLYEWTPDYWEHDDFTIQMYHGWIIIVTCTPIVGRVSAIWIRNYKFCDYLLWSYSWNLDFKSCGSANANSKPDSLFFITLGSFCMWHQTISIVSNYVQNWYERILFWQWNLLNHQSARMGYLCEMYFLVPKPK